MVNKWSYQGWLLNDCKQGLPWIQELWMSKLFHLCLHTCTSSLYFCPCLARKFMVFFQMQRQPCTEQQNSHIWSCVQSYAPYLTLTFLHCVLEQRNEAHLHGQGRELLRQAVPPCGNDSTADCSPGLHHLMLALMSPPAPSWLVLKCRGQEPLGTAVRLLHELLWIHVSLRLLNLAPSEAWGASEIFLLMCKGRIMEERHRYWEGIEVLRYWGIEKS